MTVRVGTGIDVHAFADGDASRQGWLVLCGARIEDSPPLEGHSDADVGAHAVADALLGAAGLGDLGSRFGVARPEHIDADSMELLRQVVGDVAAKGWTIANLDLRLVAQLPRLEPYRATMRENLATACLVAVEAVNVGFTTTDHLGSLGRAEGIAAWCVSLLTSSRS